MIWVWWTLSNTLCIYVHTIVTNECTVTMLLYTYHTFKNVISVTYKITSDIGIRHGHWHWHWGQVLHPTPGTLRNSTGSEISDPLRSSDQYIIVSSFILSHLIFSFRLLFSLLHTCAPLYPPDLSRTSGTLPCILLVYKP